VVIIYEVGVLDAKFLQIEKKSVKNSWTRIVMPISTKIERFFLLMKHSTLPKLHKDSSTLLGLPAKIVKLPYHAVKSFV